MYHPCDAMPCVDELRPHGTLFSTITRARSVKGESQIGSRNGSKIIERKHVRSQETQTDVNTKIVVATEYLDEPSTPAFPS